MILFVIIVEKKKGTGIVSKQKGRWKSIGFRSKPVKTILNLNIF